MAETVLAGTVRQLSRVIRECGADLGIHVLGEPRDRSLRLIRCLSRSGTCRTLAAVTLSHDPEDERSLRTAGADLYLVWPEDASILHDLIAQPPAALSNETSTSRRECAAAPSRHWDRL